MNLLVCVKQVPDTMEIKINPVTNTLIREGVPSIVNPFDAYALELAAQVRDQVGGTITVVSMGPRQAETALKECLAVGGDKAYLVTDRAFGGSDTLATSYILSCTVQYLEVQSGQPFDLILCGKQAIDGDTGQVGSEMAEHLDRPQITCITDLRVKDGKLIAHQEMDEGYNILESELPAIVSVTKTNYEPRFPTIKSKLAANRAEIPHLTTAELTGLNVERAGLKGSPTKVKKTFVPERKKAGMILKDDSPADAAKKLIDILCDAALIQGGAGL